MKEKNAYFCVYRLSNPQRNTLKGREREKRGKETKKVIERPEREERILTSTAKLESWRERGGGGRNTNNRRDL